MTASLYNCSAESPGSFLVTKFDVDLNPEATYALSRSECDCPAGHRSTCRHRQMLPLFIGNNHVDDGWFLNWNTRQWHQPLKEVASYQELPDDSTPEQVAEAFNNLPAPSSEPTPPPPQEDEAASVGEAASPITAGPIIADPAVGTEKGVASLPSPVQGSEGKAVVSPPTPTKIKFIRRV